MNRRVPLLALALLSICAALFAAAVSVPGPALAQEEERFIDVEKDGGTTGGMFFAYYARVSSRTSHESPHRAANNEARAWETWSSTGTPQARLARPDYSVRVAVDDREPDPGDTVNFAITAASGWQPLNADLFDDGCINVWLTGGLTAAHDQSFVSGTTRDCGNKTQASGFFELPQVDSTTPATMTLPVTVPSGDLSDKCLMPRYSARRPRAPAATGTTRRTTK